MNNQNFLLQVEGYAEDAFRVKRSYVDVAGDLVAGILLGQIVFWHLPNQHGQSKLRVRKGNQMWLAKSRTDWWDEIRITPKQYDRAIKILVNKGFVETKLFKFDGAPSVHIRLDFDLLVNSIFTFGENPNSPLGKMNVDEKGKSLTEITTEITTDSVVGDAVSNDLNIYKHYEKTWGIAPNASLLSMQKYQQLGFEDALIIECMEIAVKKGKRWTYAVGILDNLEHQHNVFTLEAYKALSHPPRTRSTESGTPTKNSKADFFNELAASLKEDHENDE